LALALVLRWLLEPVLADRSPFLLITVAVMVSTIYEGLAVGITATAVGAAAGLFFLDDSAPGRDRLGSGRWVQLAVYVLSCSLITVFFEMLRRYRLRTEAFAAEQRRLAEELAHANRLKDEFLATVSHELRTPLSAIVGWSGLLVQGRLGPDETRKAARTIHRNAKVQAQLVSDLLDVSSIIAGKVRVQPRAVDPRDVVAAAADAVRPAAEAKQIELRVHAGLSALVWADPDRLQQVAWNLLSNAVKFTPPQGEVVVTVEASADEARVRVEDTGPGIRPDFLPYVFDRFRQDEAPRGRARGSLGLGLSIVKHLVELHGGKVGAANRTDRTGAVFEIVLPRLESGPVVGKSAAERLRHDSLDGPSRGV
jgi:signal transduction histidine kinase